jgi:hypothetical protein
MGDGSRSAFLGFEETDFAVLAAGDLPVGVVGEPVVVGAQVDAVADISGAAVGPVPLVVEFAAFDGGLAERGFAVATGAELGGFALGAGPGAGGSAEVEDLAVAADDLPPLFRTGSVG